MAGADEKDEGRKKEEAGAGLKESRGKERGAAPGGTPISFPPLSGLGGGAPWDIAGWSVNSWSLAQSISVESCSIDFG